MEDVEERSSDVPKINHISVDEFPTVCHWLSIVGEDAVVFIIAL